MHRKIACGGVAVLANCAVSLGCGAISPTLPANLILSMPKATLDIIDTKIIAALQTDGRLSNTQLAEQVGLSPSPCLRRVKRLEQEGFI